MRVPTDEWIDRMVPRLRDDFDCHIKMLTHGLDKDQRYTLRRMLMMSLRQELLDWKHKTKETLL